MSSNADRYAGTKQAILARISDREWSQYQRRMVVNVTRKV
jgi:hypothetical protein